MEPNYQALNKINVSRSNEEGSLQLKWERSNDTVCIESFRIHLCSEHEATRNCSETERIYYEDYKLDMDGLNPNTNYRIHLLSYFSLFDDSEHEVVTFFEDVARFRPQWTNEANNTTREMNETANQLANFIENQNVTSFGPDLTNKTTDVAAVSEVGGLQSGQPGLGTSLRMLLLSSSLLLATICVLIVSFTLYRRSKKAWTPKRIW